MTDESMGDYYERQDDERDAQGVNDSPMTDSTKALAERLREYAGWTQYDRLKNLLQEAAAAIEALERERNELRQAFSDTSDHGDSLAAELTAAEARLAEAERVLVGVIDYAEHSSACGRRVSGDPCDCGRSARLLMARAFLTRTQPASPTPPKEGER